MSKDIAKKAWDLAEKEAQEKEIERVKAIIKAYLEKVSKQEAVVKKEQETLRLLKKDLDDLKEGRLDKIEERQKVDKKAQEISIIKIHKIVEEYVPKYPWRSPYEITWNTTMSPYQNQMYIALDTTNQINSMVVNGSTFNQFSGGTYDIDGRITYF